jgi:hypothetical protein
MSHHKRVIIKVLLGNREVLARLYVSRWNLSLLSQRDKLQAYSVIDINTAYKHMVKELITK